VTAATGDAGTPGDNGTPTDDDPGRRRISSGGPWEATAGYSRAIVVGDSCWVAGTTDAGPDGMSRHPGDVAAQARAVFAIIERALVEGGFRLDDVVRTRMFVRDMADSAALSTVHGEVFAGIRPAATMVAVAGLMDPSLLVEIEAEARRA
jgi:enamine deaminase RidA (YjgF/YER057c/UK114 family)